MIMHGSKRISVALFLCCTLQAFDFTSQQACSSEGGVRLVSGAGRVDSVNELEGRVEVCIGGQWGTVCDDDWDGRDAAVVCKQLGHPSPLFSTASKFSRFGNGPRIQPILRDEVQCTGSEDRLIDCFHNTTGGTDCSHSEDAGVICQGGTCSDGAVRLVGGADGKEGRVEVCFNDTWNSVCSEGWDNSDAAVVCGQLGLMQVGAIAALFGPGLGPIALENVSCSGTEQTLLQCSSDMTEGNSSQCLQHAGAVCEPPCILDGLTECGFPPNDGGINREEVCFCSADCVDFGDCCRDVQLLANCTVGDPVCNDSDVRLVEGTRTWNGRLEVCIHGQWGSVCDRHFEEVDAKVVCRELGFPAENAFALPGGTFGQIDRIWLAGVECLGIESSILECQSMGAGNFIPCRFGNASGVWCAGAAPPECTESAIRLANGTSATNGRVEVCHRGVWGTVCSDGWDERDAAVVCRELGLESAHAVAIPEQVFGSGTGPIVLDDVECTGQESRLTECSHPGIRVHNCFRTQDASVSCREGRRNITIQCDLTVNSEMTVYSYSCEVMLDLGPPTLECTIDGVPRVPCLLEDTSDVFNFEPGVHTATITVTDTLGSSDSESFNFITPGFCVSETDGVTVRVECPNSGSIPGIEEFLCSLDRGIFFGCTPPIRISALSEGPHTIAVVGRRTDENGTVAVGQSQFVIDGLDLYFINDTPQVDGTGILHAQFRTNRPGSDVLLTCRLVGRNGRTADDIQFDSTQDCASGNVTYNNLPLGDYVFRVTAKDTANGDVAVIRSGLRILGNNTFCTVTVINRRVTMFGNNATIEFGNTGSPTGFRCSLDRRPYSPCSSPVTVTNVSPGGHRLRIRPTGCGRPGIGHRRITVNFEI